MANQQASPSSTTQKDRMKAHYQSYIDYCNEQNYEGVEGFYTSPININDVPLAPSKVTEQIKSIVEAFPDWRWEIRRFTIDGEYLAVHFNITGTHLGTFQGIEATGRRITTTELTLYHMADGKFSHVWPFIDFASVIKQIS
ncbi:NTF2-like protein [Thozetella sp. PMI_491]|nr:NTF2-like protein [Thozetella sp. PMI_491]